MARERAIGALEARRNSVLLVLRSRFGDAVPKELRARIDSETDHETLSFWLRLAVFSDLRTVSDAVLG
ncbi:MAG: hypothetical protein K2W96_06645 [Gemmataceae bacterium]|nr:hypothetical protein [Gemmataceae bacterium]